MHIDEDFGEMLEEPVCVQCYTRVNQQKRCLGNYSQMSIIHYYLQPNLNVKWRINV
jgi:hypothetical protein